MAAIVTGPGTRPGVSADVPEHVQHRAVCEIPIPLVKEKERILACHPSVAMIVHTTVPAVWDQGSFTAVGIVPVATVENMRSADSQYGTICSNQPGKVRIGRLRWAQYLVHTCHWAWIAPWTRRVDSPAHKRRERPILYLYLIFATGDPGVGAAFA
jgi:hypothetical protein